MPKSSSEKSGQVPTGWVYNATDKSHYEVSIDKIEKHSGTRCATLRSIVPKPDPFGNLMQYISAENYAGKRLRMSAWVKTDIKEGTGQLWLRIDGDWNNAAQQPGCFDNMDDRPIKGKTDWTEYQLVVELPETSTGIAFGLMLIGKGQVWLDDVSFEKVGKNVPLTGRYAQKGSGSRSKTPKNLNFEG